MKEYIQTNTENYTHTYTDGHTEEGLELDRRVKKWVTKLSRGGRRLGKRETEEECVRAKRKYRSWRIKDLEATERTKGRREVG